MPVSSHASLSPASDYALEMLGISKRFHSVQALSDVTVRVRRAEVHALVGENGAGKSTLMKILDGVYPAGSYDARILVEGKPVTLRSPADARRAGIGYVPQEISVVESLSVAENLYVGNYGRGAFVTRRGMIRRAEATLSKWNIDLDAGAPVASLPASRRQLVMIARALAAEPKVLILDESTSSLTHGETKTLFDIVRNLQSRGVTILFISHKLDELAELADRLTVLRDGSAVAEFDRTGFDEHAIVAAMVGRRIETFYPSRVSAPPAETVTPVLRVRNLVVPHPHVAGRNVVDGVSFSVRPGEILGLGGLIGAGRSETLGAIYGRHRYAGEIFVAEKPVRITSPRVAKRLGIGLVVEERKAEGLLFNFNVRQNISLNALSTVSRGPVISRRCESATAVDFIRRLSIRTPSPASPVLDLSGGNQQKVVLAKALLPKPRVLLLDDPTKGVDVGAKAEIYKLLMQLAADGMALIIASSELPELLALCDRFVVLSRGHIADTFQKSDASEERFMLAATGAT